MAEHPPAALNNLDKLRALAVTFVLVDHVLEMIDHKYGLKFHPWDWNLGRAGVLLFFVHTSLVLCQSMERLRLDGLQLVKAFLIRRAFRLYPLAILVVVLVTALHIPNMPWAAWEPPSVLSLLSNLTLTMNLVYAHHLMGPMWTLPIEAQMYVALPFIFLALGTRRSPKLAMAFWGIALMLAMSYSFVTERLNVLHFAPCFLAGVLAYTLLRMKVQRIDGRLWLPFLAGLIVIHLFMLPRAPIQQWVLCLLLGVAIPMFKDSTRSHTAHYVAQYSYGIYLFHCVALWAGCIALDAPDFVQWAVVALVLAGMSVGSFHALEKPAIDYGARLARWLVVTRPAVAAETSKNLRRA